MLSFVKRTWNSPTFTTWGDQAVRFLRLIAITPLLLTKFDTSEIAAWYLFASLIFLSEIIGTRMQLTFSRMVAFAMAGATDLAPITGKRERTSGQPNWALVERTYGTVGGINAVVCLFVTVVSGAIGYYGLQAVADASTSPNQIWMAFAVMLASHAVSFWFQRYAIALKGMNHVALVNRWNAVFGALSIVAGLVALANDVGILGLTVVMQTMSLIGVLRLWWLLRRIEDGRFRNFCGYRIDREVGGWAREPFVKGLALVITNAGLLQLATVIYAREAPVAATASFAFSLRLLLALRQICEAPFNSHTPKMSRLLAQGELSKLSTLAERKIMIAQALLAIGMICLGIVGPFALRLLEANATFISLPDFLILSSLMFFQRTILFHTLLSAIGNNFVCFWSNLVSAGISVVLLLVLIPRFGFYGLCFSVFVPQIVALNIQPLLAVTAQLGVDWKAFLRRSSGAPICLQLCVLAIALWIHLSAP
jgi:Membrane protein involved in the export of O-antigen and teichoic acid